MAFLSILNHVKLGNMGTKRKTPSVKPVVTVSVKCPDCGNLRDKETNKYYAQELIEKGSRCESCVRTAQKAPRVARLSRLTDPQASTTRFWNLGVLHGACLLFRPEQKAKYGEYNHFGEMEPAHRLAYRLTHGDIPEGATIEQTCGNSRCIEPEHLKVITDELRFWERVDKSGGEATCWPWTGGMEYNYGTLMWKLEREGAHRVAYLLGHGKHPGELCVCHTCDNPICCNPKHLWLGTISDNIKDMYDKGRGYSQSRGKHNS